MRRVRRGKPHQWGPEFTTSAGVDARRCRVCSMVSTWPGARGACGYQATGSTGAQMQIVRAEVRR